jgi:ribosomal protein S18 acetylase RimI-like enzyme
LFFLLARRVHLLVISGPHLSINRRIGSNMDKNSYIHQTSVHDQYRCQEVGHALFGELERLAKENGISQFALDS